MGAPQAQLPEGREKQCGWNLCSSIFLKVHQNPDRLARWPSTMDGLASSLLIQVESKCLLCHQRAKPSVENYPQLVFGSRSTQRLTTRLAARGLRLFCLKRLPILRPDQQA